MHLIALSTKLGRPTFGPATLRLMSMKRGELVFGEWLGKLHESFRTAARHSSARSSPSNERSELYSPSKKVQAVAKRIRISDNKYR